MSNRKKVASIAFTGAAVAGATLMTTAPAVAAVSSWHVRNNGLNYTGAFTAKNKAGTSASFKDVTTGLVMKCKKANVSGSLSKSKSSAAAPKLGLVKPIVTEWKSCQAGGLFHFHASLTTSPALIAQRFSAGTHTMTGKLSGDNISIFLSASGAITCVASFSGTSVPLTYMNTPHSFSINPARMATLKVKAAAHCLGQINAGDRIYIHSTYHVSPPIGLTFTRSAS